jgi:hypothetical protein
MDINSIYYSTFEDKDIVVSTLSKLQDKRHTKVQLIEGKDEIIKYYVETNADLKRYLDINHGVEYKSKLKLSKSKLQNGKTVIYVVLITFTNQTLCKIQ